MMLARLMLVTHSSSLRMLEGMGWRQICRGSIFLVTRGMVGCAGGRAAQPCWKRRGRSGEWKTYKCNQINIQFYYTFAPNEHLFSLWHDCELVLNKSHETDAYKNTLTQTELKQKQNYAFAPPIEHVPPTRFRVDKSKMSKIAKSRTRWICDFRTA